MSFRRFLTHKDLRIAKVGKKPSMAPCAEYMSAYMDCMSFGTHDSKVPPHLSREFHRCINEFYDVSTFANLLDVRHAFDLIFYSWLAGWLAGWLSK